MADIKFDYQGVAAEYKNFKEIVGDPGDASSIAGILQKANEHMEEHCNVPDEAETAIYGDLGSQLKLDWDNFSSDFPVFVTEFNNWAAKVAESAGNYQQAEADIAALHASHPFGFASQEGMTANYVEGGTVHQYATANQAAYEERMANFGGFYELTGAEYVDTGHADHRVRSTLLRAGEEALAIFSFFGGVKAFKAGTQIWKQGFQTWKSIMAARSGATVTNTTTTANWTISGKDQANASGLNRFSKKLPDGVKYVSDKAYSQAVQAGEDVSHMVTKSQIQGWATEFAQTGQVPKAAADLGIGVDAFDDYAVAFANKMGGTGSATTPEQAREYMKQWVDNGHTLGAGERVVTDDLHNFTRSEIDNHLGQVRVKTPTGTTYVDSNSLNVTYTATSTAGDTAAATTSLRTQIASMSDDYAEQLLRNAGHGEMVDALTIDGGSPRDLLSGMLKSGELSRGALFRSGVKTLASNARSFGTWVHDGVTEYGGLRTIGRNLGQSAWNYRSSILPAAAGVGAEAIEANR